jgi:hypothetical protein
MLPIKTPSKSGASVFQCEYFGDRGPQFVIVDQLRNLDELGSVRFDDEVDGRNAAFGGSVLRRCGRDRDEPAAASEHSRRSLQRLATDSVEHQVDFIHDVFKTHGLVIDNLVGAEPPGDGKAARRCGSDDMGTASMRKLHSHATDTADRTMDKDPLSHS